MLDKVVITIPASDPAEKVEDLAQRIIRQAISEASSRTSNATVKIVCSYDHRKIHPNLLRLVLMIMSFGMKELKYDSSRVSDHTFAYFKPRF